MIGKILIALAAALCLLPLLSPVEAGSCAGYARTYTAPTYAAPLKSYAAPSYAVHAAKAYDYQADIYFPKFLAVVPLVQYPSYSAVYAPPVPGQIPGAADPARQQQTQGEMTQVLSGLKEVTTTLRDLDSRLRRLEERSGVQPIPQQLPPVQQAPKQSAPKQNAPAPKQQGQNTGVKHTFASVNAAFCAACHAKGNEANGGDFVLSDNGVIVKLTDAQVGAMQRVLLKGKMPKLNAHAKNNGIERMLTAEEAQAVLEEVDRQLSN